MKIQLNHFNNVMSHVYFILHSMSVDPVEMLNTGPLNLYFERPLVLWSQCKSGQRLHTTSLFAGRSCVNTFTGTGLQGNLAVYTSALRFMAWRPCVYRALWGQGEFSQRDRSRECAKLTGRTVRARENVFIHDHIQRAVGWERPVSEQHA